MWVERASNSWQRDAVGWYASVFRFGDRDVEYPLHYRWGVSRLGSSECVSGVEKTRALAMTRAENVLLAITQPLALADGK